MRFPSTQTDLSRSLGNVATMSHSLDFVNNISHPTFFPPIGVDFIKLGDNSTKEDENVF